METEGIDVRKLEPAGPAQLRRIAIRLRQRGQSQTAIAEELGLRRATVSGWLAQARAGHGVNEAKCGRSLGQGRKLTPAQEQRLRQDIGDLTPDQRKLSLALWKAQAVRALIMGYFAIDLLVRSVRNYLKRWGFTPQRPLKRAFEQKPEAVQKWLTEEYPPLQCAPSVRERHSAGAMRRRYPRWSMTRAATRQRARRRCWCFRTPSASGSTSLRPLPTRASCA